ncbi:hypothetical protein HAX54_016015 [Datura stramonium]|uniref:Uncharacterized protein n=1 Tax=Datura stramonium TaxID=4076 RepID=A0ABS8RZH4_DATST|nr:hypothetical protein [Datura stramonium]
MPNKSRNYFHDYEQDGKNSFLGGDGEEKRDLSGEEIRRRGDAGVVGSADHGGNGRVPGVHLCYGASPGVNGGYGDARR